MHIDTVGHYSVGVYLNATRDEARPYRAGHHKKIEQIKTLRAGLGIGLKEAKDLMEYIHEQDDEYVEMQLTPAQTAHMIWLGVDAECITVGLRNCVEKSDHRPEPRIKLDYSKG